MTNELTQYEALQKCLITPQTEVPQHRFLLSWQHRPCFPRGELVALTGKAKSGKTYFTSILMALSVRPNLFGISRLEEQPFRTLWIDTEQSADSTKEILCDRLLSIASFAQCCIVCVLHQNKSAEDKTLRGALGTELQNKSFETYESRKDPDTHIFTVQQTATRKYDITAKLQFCVSSEGLPQSCYTPATEDSNGTPDSCKLQKPYNLFGHPVRH